MEPLAPVDVLALAPSSRYLLWVELEQGRLDVMENLGDAGIVIRKRIPVSIGKQGIGKRTEGDKKRPLAFTGYSSSCRTTSLMTFTASVLGRSITRMRLTNCSRVPGTASGCTACQRPKSSAHS